MDSAHMLQLELEHTKAELEQTKAEKEQARAKLEQARAKLEQARATVQEQQTYINELKNGQESLIGTQVAQVVESLKLPDSAFERVKSDIITGIKRGLGVTDIEATAAHIKLLATYVTDMSGNNETGDVVVLDIGDRECILKVVRLSTNNPDQALHTMRFDIDSYMAEGHEQELEGGVVAGAHYCQLFDGIAGDLETFLEERGLLPREPHGPPFPMAFICRFPCEQDGLTAGCLLSATKEFRCADAEGKDIVRLLREAVNRRPNLHGSVDLGALVNDTVNCLMSVASTDPNCRVGVILDSGINACFRKMRERVKKAELRGNAHSQQEVTLNTELGAFGIHGCLDFIWTFIDKTLDKHSEKPGQQIFEKMTSGKYIPEIVRLILQHLTDGKLLFGGCSTPSLNEPYRFHLKYISEIERDILHGQVNVTRDILAELGLENISAQDCQIVQEICLLVQERAARLAAAGVAAVIECIDQAPVTVAISGDLFTDRFHPIYKDSFTAQLHKLVNPQIQYTLQQLNDSSGCGAARIAAQAQHQNCHLLQVPGSSLDHCLSNSSINSDA